MNITLRRQLQSSANALYSHFSGQTAWGACLTMSAMEMCESEPMSAAYILAVADSLRTQNDLFIECAQNNNAY